MKLLADIPDTGNLGGFESPSTNSIFQPPTATDASQAGANLESILSLIIGFLTVIAGLSFMLFFIFGAMQWIMAAGDQGKVESARKQMTNGAIGLIIVVVSYGIIAVVSEVLGLPILNPAELLQTLGPQG